MNLINKFRAKYIQRWFQKFINKDKILTRLNLLARLLTQLSRVFENPFSCLILTIICLWSFGKSSPVKQDFLLAGFSGLEDNPKVFLGQKDSIILDFPKIVVGENSFKQTIPVASRKGMVLGSLAGDSFFEPGFADRKEIIEYLVRSGDTLSSIAEKFGISLETVLWANDLTSRSSIRSGQKLTILPVTGITHLVKPGETLSQLAKEYKSDVIEIADFNELFEENEIFSGDLLVIPEGRMPLRPIVNKYTPLASSYFMCPVSAPCHITQGLHWYNAIDFSNNRCGEPVFAAAGGIVQKIGFDNVAGRFIRVLHPNGVVTFYGHLAKILVYSGETVSQGRIIGYTGNTGYTVGPTGCHLHFEVRGAVNPFAR